MSNTPVSNIDSLTNGSLLQIAFSDGVRNQISEDFRDFEFVSRFRVNDTLARELRFMLQTGFGPAAIQYASVSAADSAFPASQDSETSEKTAKLKELRATVKLDYSLYDRIRKSPEKYADLLALEVQNKTIAAKRRVAADFHGDGSGIVATVSSAVDSDSTDTVVVTLKSGATDRGHVGMCEYGDIYSTKQNDGTDRDHTNSAEYGWKVISKDRANNTVTLRAIDSAGAAYNFGAASNLVSGDYLIRVGQAPNGTNGPDLASSIADYGTLSFVPPGLDSIAASDGRVCHSITMSGATGSTEISASGNAIDSKYIQQALDLAKVNVGSTYKYKMMTMAPETQAALINSREADRRFQSVEDNKRGVRFWAYQHGSDVLEAATSEFCKPKKLWMLPEASNGNKPLELWGTDFEEVRGEGMNSWHLNSGSSGYTNSMVSFLKSYYTFICKHPASIAVVSNFSTSV